MSNYRRANTNDGNYFFTVVTYRRHKFVYDEKIRSAFRESVRATKTIHPFTIDGWVLLPDHLNCIGTMAFDDGDFGVSWKVTKRYVIKKWGKSQIIN